ncbi:MAG TPA: RES family NAD+ phosphorylase [Chitinophagales bacterium]|nr:RES family NAD+ phosphorylase [Chitinophagales bacterium]HMW13556.1 RES family NAD+ phosphorylase [Chitinophagales bacterium]HMX60616.1 RES family NAD+ phosphorylase [Chitinophagales bacterium]HMY23631.1 RES family NAD+ phosphorylase [Chitinophagales bacterium]HMZ34163.1 RES family NAD+ phosphorylase [Chitinophagales bacterium]
MIVYRICNKLYANDLQGIGAKMYGGRWNNVGNAVVYTSSSRALAALEVLVHLPSTTLKKLDFTVVSIEIPENSVEEIFYDDIKRDFQINRFSAFFKNIGDNWLRENKSLLLKVPSVVIHEEMNYLINPNHKDFNKVKLTETKLFRFDDRLAK